MTPIEHPRVTGMRQPLDSDPEHATDHTSLPVDGVDGDHARPEDRRDQDLTEVSATERIARTDPSRSSQPMLAVRSTVTSAIWFHWVIFALSLLVVVLAMTMRVPGQEQVYLPGMSSPVPGMCASRQLFGMNCPGCGLTRSFICLGHGQFSRAWHFNPGGFLFFLFVAAQIPWRLTQLALIYAGIGERWIGVFDWVPWVVASALILQWIVRFFT